MDELIARLEAAESELLPHLDHFITRSDATNTWRIKGELCGIRLALSYAREMTRG